MTPEIRTLVIAALTQAKKFTSKSLIQDYLSLKNNVLRLELEQNIEVIEQMLQSTEMFEVQFRRWLNQRSRAPRLSTTLCDAPKSLTNQLLWQITLIVFKPKTLGDALAILLPQITSHVQLHFTIKAPKIVQPRLELVPNLLALTEPPTIKSFCLYAIADQTIFRVDDLANLPLRMHHDLCAQLETHYPSLAKKIYSHNDDLRTLASDIRLLHQSGLTWRNIITQLIDAFINGGTIMTGGEFANSGAEKARSLFFDYFQTIPETTQNALRALPFNNDRTFNNIYLQIQRGDCVETTAGCLTIFLKKHPHHPLLDVPIKMSQEGLHHLEQKYKYTADNQPVLRTQQQSEAPLPSCLLEMGIQNMPPLDTIGLLSILIGLPISYYGILFQKVTLNLSLHELYAPLRYGFFSDVQQIALIQCLLHSYRHSNQFLAWVIELDDFDLVGKVINLLSMPEWRRLCQFAFDRVFNSHHFYKNTFRALLQAYVQINRSGLFKTPYINTLFELAHTRSELVYLFSIIPVKKRLAAIQHFSRMPNHGLYSSTILEILALIPQQHRILAIYCKNSCLNLRCLSNGAEVLVAIQLFSRDEWKHLLNYRSICNSLLSLEPSTRRDFLRTLSADELFLLFKNTADNAQEGFANKDHLIILFLEVIRADSFISSYMKIYSYLEKQARYEQNSWNFFGKTPASRLLKAIAQLDSLASIEQHLYGYCFVNFYSEFCTRLLASLSYDHFATKVSAAVHYKEKENVSLCVIQ